MLGNKQEKDHSCHSQDRRKSMTKAEFKRYKLEQMKLKFKSITNKIKQIKSSNSSDLNHIDYLIKNSDNIQKMAHHSLEKAKELLSSSKNEKNKAIYSSLPKSEGTTQLITQSQNNQNKIKYHHDNGNDLINEQNIRTSVHDKTDKKQYIKIRNLNSSHEKQQSKLNSKGLHKRSFQNIQPQKMKQTKYDANNKLQRQMTLTSTIKDSQLLKNVSSFGKPHKRQQKRSLINGVYPFIGALLVSILLLFLLHQ